MNNEIAIAKQRRLRKYARIGAVYLAPLSLSLAMASAPLQAAPGYRGGQPLPSSFSQTINAASHGVIASDGIDDSAALQNIIDTMIPLGNSPSNRIAIQLPAGEIHLDDEVHVDRSGVVILGAGNSPSSGTKITVRSWQPYGVDASGAPDFDKKYWPGFGAFRAETRIKHANEPAYEGSVNFHWKHGIEFDQAASLGDTVLHLEANAASKFSVGDLIYVGAATDTAFLDLGEVPSSKRSKSHLQTGHMRTQIFTVTARNTSNDTVTLNAPLEFDIPINNSSGYKSRVMPVTAVQDVGFRDFYLQMSTTGTNCAGYNGNDYSTSNPSGVGHKYVNLCPEDAIHGIIFKWATDGWVDNVRIEMMGSHPLVTEFARHMTFKNNHFHGSWNKGAGGNGYVRGSKLYDSLIQGNTLERLRHLTLQWSATGNIVENNTLDCDINLHGGWERNNLIRNNTVAVPFEHRNWANGAPDSGTWQPVWYGSGDHASDWSGPTGPNNVFLNNSFSKGVSAGSSIVPWGLFDDAGVSYAFAWDGNQYKHLNISGTPIASWNQDNAELVAQQMPLSGVYTSSSSGGGSSSSSSSSSSGGSSSSSSSSSGGGGSCSTIITIPWDQRTEVTLQAGACVQFDRDLSGESLQVWDSDANPSCDFRGTITSVDGSGSLAVSSNYASSNGFSGTTLKYQPNNGCYYVKTRAY
ncbi:right-handed parallel beta-helix repeat-containing protein [Microbulbifer sp. YPW1]|uniref:right-handed parallel beta-helix repeat-containing protein n=1 Tax=Microbulbifer sp. YPW1 TaxID=2745199 RepID=UPI00159AE512|nr:right-handed parallel beta-helix repeat-containing protein [Microbulbifer sp. YPW1]QKX16995.1 right-handed parallel beta-helix repeat-containing protein [Microbulbifer sp. YPW1]